MAAAYKSNYINATDILPHGEVTLEITEVIAPNTVKSEDGKLINKGILAFKGATKKLIVQPTNHSVLKLLHGPKPSAWKGHKVTLIVRYLEKAFGQTNVPVVRVKTTDDKPLPFSVRKKYGSPVPFGGQ